MTGLVSSTLQHFTYAGMFLILVMCGMGLPLPEDFVLLASGFLVHQGVTRYPTTLAVAFVGVVWGDHTLYFLGRRFGTGLVAYLGLARPHSQKQIEWLKGFMNRHGHRAIFYARFLAGLRALVYLTAGSLEVEPVRFSLYDIAGALISVPIVVSIGYIFGDELATAVQWLGGVEKLIWLVLALSAGIYAMRMVILTRGGQGGAT